MVSVNNIFDYASIVDEINNRIEFELSADYVVDGDCLILTNKDGIKAEINLDDRTVRVSTEEREDIDIDSAREFIDKVEEIVEELSEIEETDNSDDLYDEEDYYNDEIEENEYDSDNW